MNFEEIKELYELTTNEDGYVYLLITGDNSFATYPLKDLSECVLISQEDCTKLFNGEISLSEVEIVPNFGIKEQVEEIIEEAPNDECGENESATGAE